MFTYYSVHCSDYGALFYVLMHHHVPFEWHSSLCGCRHCYADFTLNNDLHPSFGDIVADLKESCAKKGKKVVVHVMSTYTI